MMANPHEYRESLWSILYTGELTPEMKAKIAENKPKAAKASIGKPIPKSALSELEELQAHIASLQQGKDEK